MTGTLVVSLAAFGALILTALATKKTLPLGQALGMGVPPVRPALRIVACGSDARRAWGLATSRVDGLRRAGIRLRA